MNSKEDLNRALSNQNILQKIFYFYKDGFKAMTLGRTLWKLILVKLFIIFFVFKLFLFPDVLEKQFENDSQKIEHVTQILTKQY